MKDKKVKDGAKNEYENTIWNRDRKGIRKMKNKLKFATMNIQGINTLGKRQEIEKWMKKKKIDLLCIQETKINCNAMECRSGYTWYFSSGVKDAGRDKATKLKNSNKKIPPSLQEKIREHRGVGFVCSNELHEHVKTITAHDSNNITLNIKGTVDIIFHNTYQPRAGEKMQTKRRENTEKCKK